MNISNKSRAAFKQVKKLRLAVHTKYNGHPYTVEFDWLDCDLDIEELGTLTILNIMDNDEKFIDMIEEAFKGWFEYD